MSRTTKLLGTVSVLATLTASPAAAQLGGFAGFVDLGYSHSSVDLDSDFFGNVDTDGWNGFNIGGGIAFAVDEVPGIAWQLDANYSSQRGDGTICTDPFDIDTCFSGDQSRIVWNLGGSLFWNGVAGRLGVNVNYETTTDFGSLTNGGIFGEAYFGNITVQAKGGWLWGGGTPAGGRGNYLGLGGLFYFIPNLAVGASLGWSDMISGSTGVGGGMLTVPWPCSGATCGRRGVNETNVTLSGEFMVSAALPLSVFGGYAYSNVSTGSNIGNPFTADETETSHNTFFIGVRWYMGGGGPLINQHRNGNVHPFLRGGN